METRPLLGDPLQDGRLEHVGARVDLVGRRLVAGRLLDEGGDPPVCVGGNDPERRGVWDRMQRDRPLGADAAVERHEAGQIEVGHDIAVDDHEGVVDAGGGGRESDSAGRVERLRLDGIRQPHAGCPSVRVGLEESVGQVTERQYGLVHPVPSQVAEHALQHGHAHHREHLLGCR